MSKFTITTEHQGQRLDKFLTEKLPNLSRSQIQKTIKSGQVLVNDQKPSPHHFLKTGDIIQMDRFGFGKVESVSKHTVSIIYTHN